MTLFSDDFNGSAGSKPSPTLWAAAIGGRWPFVTTPMCALVDLDMGGWGGSVTIPGPVSMLVDYVKVTALTT